MDANAIDTLFKVAWTLLLGWNLRESVAQRERLAKVETKIDTFQQWCDKCQMRLRVPPPQ